MPDSYKHSPGVIGRVLYAEAASVQNDSAIGLSDAALAEINYFVEGVLGKLPSGAS